LLVIIILLSIGFLIWYFDLLAPLIYSKTIENDEEIELSGTEVLVIKNTYYIQRNNIVLRNKAKLIIEDSLFKHLQTHDLELSLEAKDQSQVIIRNSQIKSNGWIPWEIQDNSTLVIENTNNLFSGIWSSCGDYSKCFIRNSSKAEITIYGSALLEISNVPAIFVEVGLPHEARVNEQFPSVAKDYRFPNEGELGIPFILKVRNAEKARWGISISVNSNITVRDTDSLAVGFYIRELNKNNKVKYENNKIELSNLRNKHYQDKVWQVGNIKLHLINTKVENWYIYVDGNLTLVVKDSQVSDNILSSGMAKIFYENVESGVIRGRDHVEFVIKDSTLTKDVIAEDDSRIILINTEVKGNLIEKDNGKIIVSSRK
jgi:hypothetical protein